MHQNPFTSPDSPGSSKFPCSRGRSACWARFRRSDRCFKLSCRWRKETLQDWEVSGRNHVVCLETHTNLETLELEPWISSESLPVGHFSLVVALPIITPLWSCNVKKKQTHSPSSVSHSHIASNVSIVSYPTNIFFHFLKATVIFRELHLSLVALGLQSFQLHQPLQAGQLQFIQRWRLFGRCCCSFPTYPWLQRHGICIICIMPA